MKVIKATLKEHYWFKPLRELAHMLKANSLKVKDRGLEVEVWCWIFILKMMTEKVEQELGILPNPIRKNTVGKREDH